MKDSGVKNKMLTKSELVSLGMKPGWILAVLDAPDETGPSEHWLNKSGTPFYDIERVKVACARVGVQFSDVSELYIETWVRCDRPTSKPVLSFDFHALSELVIPGVARDFRSLRISHPVLGREKGSLEKELQLVDLSLRAMIKACFQKDLVDDNMGQVFTDISDSGLRNLGFSRANEVIVREAYHRSYLPKSSSLSSVRKFLFLMALIHVGAICAPSGIVQDVRRFLVSCPRIRVDSTAVRIAGRNPVFSTEVHDHLVSELLNASQANTREVEHSQVVESVESVEIAKGAGNDECAEQTSKCKSPACKQIIESSDIKIEGVIGVVRRLVWLRLYHFVFEVQTNFGGAYLYPPGLDDCAKLVFKTEPSTSMGRTIHVTADLKEILSALAHELENLKAIFR